VQLLFRIVSEEGSSRLTIDKTINNFIYFFRMNLQQLNPKILSITQLRQDIDILNKILRKEKEAIVMKNQKVLFMVVDPEKYKQLKEKKEKDSFEEALRIMEELRSKYKSKNNAVSSYVIKMRDERRKKWIKS
jgi:DNA repair exonuclease SbcCD nuclease subunit